ncbi:MAG: hypothetical protein IJ870_01575 [Alphaproteobacteria bacterium]|nr:hypothetical protein [Alphaproteobacteria bacterium]
MADFDSQNEIMVGGRRMRKIKRPKQHTGPYTQEMASNNVVETPQSVQQAPAQPVNLPYVQQEPQYRETPVPNYVQDEGYTYDDAPYQENPTYTYDSIEKKKVLWIALACLCFGLLIGKFFLGSSQVVQNGLQGVVLNPEVPKGRSRCGVAEKTQGCVLYVMNPQRQELNGRDFYDLASQLTGRQRFVIETGNMRYSSVKIRPGSIAQLNIPPLQ